jgi:uncharacterized protein (TIGR04562 family)
MYGKFMERPSYLSKYLFEWDLFEVVIGGRSALDSRFFIGPMFDKEQVNDFLSGYGFDSADPIIRAELFGNFQEAVQFIKRYFLEEGNPDCLDLKIPNSIFMISDVAELFLMATGNAYVTTEERLWAEIVLKVMHTILHADKDLRSNYFSTIQTQIFDRFYKYIHRDEEDNLFLGQPDDPDRIPLLDFETKSKKSRESIIIKMLHKIENVAEELFDRIGIRIVTKTRLDTLRVIRYLMLKNVIIPHNIKPSRSMNSMIDTSLFKEKHKAIVKMAIRNNISEEDFLIALNKEAVECSMDSASDRNSHSSQNYESIQFTCRQLIKYKNPFLNNFQSLRQMAKKEDTDSEITKKILSMDISLIAKEARFFYPFEVQILDEKAQYNNSIGDASHEEYKKSQIKSAMKRVFWALLEHKKMIID